MPVGELAKCMAVPTKLEECIEVILNRVLTQERTLSHSLQVSFPQKAYIQAQSEVNRARDNLRHLARDLGYKGYF